MPLHADVKVEHNEVMGRTIIAQRAFNPGETVVTDRPVLVWDDPPDRGAAFLLRAFLKTDKATQKRILGMYHPALDRDSAMLKLRRKKAVGVPRPRATKGARVRPAPPSGPEPRLEARGTQLGVGRPRSFEADARGPKPRSWSPR